MSPAKRIFILKKFFFVEFTLLIFQPCKLVRDPWGHGSIKGGKDIAGEKGGPDFWATRIAHHSGKDHKYFQH